MPSLTFDWGSLGWAMELCLEGPLCCVTWSAVLLWCGHLLYYSPSQTDNFDCKSIHYWYFYLLIFVFWFLFILSICPLVSLSFLGPWWPLRVPRSSVRLSVCPQQKFQITEIHYKSLHYHVRPIKSFLKANDPHNPLTLRDDKDNDKYKHKYTN